MLPRIEEIPDNFEKNIYCRLKWRLSSAEVDERAGRDEPPFDEKTKNKFLFWAFTSVGGNTFKNKVYLF